MTDNVHANPGKDDLTSLHWDQFAADFRWTPRELAVVRLVCEGLPNKVIARRLGCSIWTVKCHLSHVFEKTGWHGRTELMHGLIEAHLHQFLQVEGRK